MMVGTKNYEFKLRDTSGHEHDFWMDGEGGLAFDLKPMSIAAFDARSLKEMRRQLDKVIPILENQDAIQAGQLSLGLSTGAKATGE